VLLFSVLDGGAGAAAIGLAEVAASAKFILVALAVLGILAGLLALTGPGEAPADRL
jgi:hypothetical protein